MRRRKVDCVCCQCAAWEHGEGEWHRGWCRRSGLQTPPRHGCAAWRDDEGACAEWEGSEWTAPWAGEKRRVIVARDGMTELEWPSVRAAAACMGVGRGALARQLEAGGCEWMGAQVGYEWRW